MGTMADRKNDSDYLLAPENDRGLNEAFYRARPHAYFNQRLESLILIAGRSGQLAELLAEGITIGRLKVGGTPRPDLTGPQRAEVEQDRERFIIAEAEVLLHHAAETLLRLYLAHEYLPPCPWLVLAGERSFAGFKEKVAKLGEELADEQRRTNVAAVFFGASDRSSLQPTPPEDEWKAGLENVSTWLAWFAAHFLDAGVYNAAKHGLALQAGNAAFQLGNDELISRSGSSLEYVDSYKDDSGRRRWRRTTQWLDPDRWMGHIFLACRLLKALTEVARARYTGAPLTHVDLFTSPRFEDTVINNMEFTKLSFDLLYYVDPASDGTTDERPPPR